MSRKVNSAESIRLIPAEDFLKVASHVFAVSKTELDRQVAASKKKHKRKGK